MHLSSRSLHPPSLYKAKMQGKLAQEVSIFLVRCLKQTARNAERLLKRASLKFAILNSKRGMDRGLHPPSTNSGGGSANLLSGNEHRNGLYLAGFGKLFAFSLGEPFVD